MKPLFLPFKMSLSSVTTPYLTSDSTDVIIGKKIVPISDGDLDIGTPTAQFRDVYFSGQLYQDGTAFVGGGGGVDMTVINLILSSHTS